MYQTILQLENKAIIINYKIEATKNENRVGIKEKEALLNFSEAILKYLVYLHDYFLNERSNGKKSNWNFVFYIIKTLIKLYW